MYKATVIQNETRIRNDHNTASARLYDHLLAGTVIQGEELFVATQNLSNASGVYQYIGDKWLKHTYNGITGWTAVIHLGGEVCRDFQLVGEEPTTPPAPVFPESFILDDGKGNKAEYLFNKIV